jgi:hypothetical protein
MLISAIQELRSLYNRGILAMVELELNCFSLVSVVIESVSMLSRLETESDWSV